MSLSVQHNFCNIQFEIQGKNSAWKELCITIVNYKPFSRKENANTITTKPFRRRSQNAKVNFKG